MINEKIFFKEIDLALELLQNSKNWQAEDSLELAYKLHEKAPLNRMLSIDDCFLVVCFCKQILLGF